MKWLWNKIKTWWKNTWKELKDWKTLILFIVVTIILSSEVWVPYLIALITGSKWWWGIGSLWWAFWLGPGTPFTLIDITITIAIKKLWIKLKEKKHVKIRKPRIQKSGRTSREESE